jgi:hypothetical protein
MEQLQYTIGDHERTILKFRETVKTMQVCFSHHWINNSSIGLLFSFKMNKVKKKLKNMVNN